MRVLLYVDHDLEQPGGVETHVRQLATSLAARGHAIEIYGRPATLPPFTLVDRVDPDRYDVLHHHDGAWPRGLDVGRRYVRTFHLCVAAKMAAYVRIGRLRTLARPGNWSAVFEERASCRRTGFLIGVAERVRADLARWYGLEPARLRVIPNGVSFSSPPGDRAARRARHGIPERAPVLLTIGRDDYVKGYDLLDRAWRRSRMGERGACWVTVGGAGPRRAPGRLVTGPIPHDQVRDWVAAADVGAMPSHYEGCGLALLEMLAGGLFCLAHDVGIASEVIEEGVNGRIVAGSLEAWVEALPATLDRLPPRPVQGLGDEFSWDHVAGRIEEVYRESASSARSGPP